MDEAIDRPEDGAHRDEQLDQVTRELVRTRDPSSVLQRLADLALAGAAVTAVYLERVDFEANEVEVIATAGDAPPAIGVRIPYPGSLAAEVLESDRPEVVTPEEMARRPIAVTLTDSCRRCNALVVPLISEGDAVGALILLRPVDQSAFTEEETARTRAVGDLAALGLRRVLLDAEVARGAAAAQESDERFRLLVQSVRDYAIFMLDARGGIVSWNEGAERINGYSEDEVLGRHFSIFYSDTDREQGHPQAELTAADRDGVYEEEGWRLRKDGTRFWAHVTITAMRNAAGTLVGFAKVTRDLTERHQAEQEREQLLQSEREARIEAERANRAKSEFLSTMSHELRTPLNAIIGYVDLLEAEVVGEINDQQRAYLERSRLSGRHLLALIGDVLDVARIEAGRVEVHPRIVRADEAVRGAFELVQPQADAKELEIEITCTAGDDVMLRADCDRLQQILVNLLSNAVKFTGSGGRIGAWCEVVRELEADAEVAGAGPWVLIRIEDTGIGITPEQMERIWNPFEQAESGPARLSEGAGLGLTISRSLARLMGGDLVARSEPASGSAFLLILPAAEAAVTGDAAMPDDRRGRERKTPGVAMVGEAVLCEIAPIVQSYTARVKEDAEIPGTTRMSDTVLKDHAATLLVDIAEALCAIDEAAGAPSAFVRDSQAIQQLIAESHGQRRAWSGWSAAEISRGYEILREEMELAVRRRVERTTFGDPADAHTALEHGLALFAQFLKRAEKLSVRELEKV